MVVIIVGTGAVLRVCLWGASTNIQSHRRRFVLKVVGGKKGELRSNKIHAKPNTTEVREEKAHHRYLQLVHFSNEGAGFGLCVENTCQWRRACTGEQHGPQYDRPVDQPDVGRERRPQT